MTYHVVWLPPAFNRMNAIVRDNPALAAEFAAALRELTAALSTDPVGTGESREPYYRFAVFGPLAVTFRPFPAEDAVLVVRVRMPRKR